MLAYARAHLGWFYTNECRLFPQEVAHSGAIKTGDKLTIHVVHTKPGDKDNGNGNGGEKK